MRVCLLRLHELPPLVMPIVFDLHVFLFGVCIFWLCNKKVSYLSHSLDNTTINSVKSALERSNQVSKDDFT